MAKTKQTEEQVDVLVRHNGFSEWAKEAETEYSSRIQAGFELESLDLDGKYDKETKVFEFVAGMRFKRKTDSEL